MATAWPAVQQVRRGRWSFVVPDTHAPWLGDFQGAFARITVIFSCRRCGGLYATEPRDHVVEGRCTCDFPMLADKTVLNNAHVIIGPFGMCFCGIFGGKTIRCADLINAAKVESKTK